MPGTKEEHLCIAVAGHFTSQVPFLSFS